MQRIATFGIFYLIAWFFGLIFSREFGTSKFWQHSMVDVDRDTPDQIRLAGFAAMFLYEDKMTLYVA